MLHFIIFLYITLVHNGNSQSARPNGDLTSHILHLEQTVSDLQAQNQAQEQKQAAVLSSILSKLSSTIDKLQALELKHNSTLLELTELKNWKVGAEREQQRCISNYTSVTKQLKNVTTELTTLRINQDSTTRVVNKIEERDDLLIGLLNQTASSTCVRKGFNETKCSWYEEIGFQAELSFDVLNTSADDEVLKFDDVKYNAADGYNSSTGIYVASASGSYLFWCHVMSFNHKPLFINLHHNTVVISKGYTNVYAGVASLTRVLHLDEGDNVWFSTFSSTSIHGWGFSSFGGTLLQRTKR